MCARPAGYSAQIERGAAQTSGVEIGKGIDKLLQHVGGQVIADDWLYVQSGYSMFGQLPGNVLLAYRVREATP